MKRYITPFILNNLAKKQERAGNLIVLSNLAEDLQISPKTAKNWLAFLTQHG